MPAITKSNCEVFSSKFSYSKADMALVQLSANDLLRCQPQTCHKYNGIFLYKFDTRYESIIMRPIYEDCTGSSESDSTIGHLPQCDEHTEKLYSDVKIFETNPPPVTKERPKIPYSFKWCLLKKLNEFTNRHLCVVDISFLYVSKRPTVYIGYTLLWQIICR